MLAKHYWHAFTRSLQYFLSSQTNYKEPEFVETCIYSVHAWSINYCIDVCTWNQSMVQQLTREGNILSLVLNASPMGLIASTTWSCSLTRSMNMLNRARGVPSVCLDFSRALCVCVGSRRWRTVCQELARAVSTSLKVTEDQWMHVTLNSINYTS